MTDKETPYLMKGAKPPTSESSILLSSSRYLNDPRLREAIALRMLGKNGNDLPSTYTLPALFQALAENEDYEELFTLIATERHTNKAFDAWMSEGFLSTMSRDDFRDFPEGTVGRIYYEYLYDREFEPNIVTFKEPENEMEYWVIRASQVHDVFEHILAGAPFDIINEMVPTSMKIASVHKHLSSGLAGKFTIINSILTTSQINRATLHYPSCVPALLERLERGLLIGRTSEPYFMMKYEDILHLTVEEARKAIGMNNTLEVDYGELSDVISEGQYSRDAAAAAARRQQRLAAEAA